MPFKNKKEDDKSSLEKEESVKFTTVSVMLEVANLNGHT